MTTDNDRQGGVEATEQTVNPDTAVQQPLMEDTTGEVATAPAKSEREVELERQLDELEQRAKSAEGRLRARSDTSSLQTELADIRSEMRRDRRERRRRELEDGIMEDGMRQQALKQLDDEEQLDANQGQVIAHATKLARRINPRLERMGLNSDHPKVQEALAKWDQARTQEDFDDVYDELDDLIEAERESRASNELQAARQEVAETRQRYNQDKNTLDVGLNGADSGQVGGMSDQSTWDAYGRGEITWSKRVEEAGKKLNYLPS